MKPSGATFIYRGQLRLERSRLDFLLEAACGSFDHVDVILLSPRGIDQASTLADFVRHHSAVRSANIVQATRALPSATRRAVGRLLRDDAPYAIVVGFSAASFIPGRCPALWCVNGIPEERLLTSTALRSRAAVWLDWRAARRLRADRALVVSSPMAEVIATRTGLPTTIVPNAVDRQSFPPPGPEIVPRYLTYEGGGSPWQGLGHLAAIWRELHLLDDQLQFRVITRDPRAHVLASDLPADVVDLRSADDHHEVSRLLQESRLAFMVREPGIVNRVAWPMKLGEYLASGSPVVVSRCGWDAERLVERHGAGLTVDWSASAPKTARAILEYLRELGSTRPDGVEAAADELSSDKWMSVMYQLLSTGPQAAARDEPHEVAL